MMTGKFKEYNWRDIMRLIYSDAGMPDDESFRLHGDVWFLNGFIPPSFNETIVRVQVYEKDFETRNQEHFQDETQ